jgi:pimeloyl-ACP methyl ester carboxylesterase
MKKLIFIHGAFGTEADLKPLAELCSGIQIELLSLPFHGRDSGPRFSYNDLKNGLKERLKSETNYSIFGYSLGGHLALDLAASGLITPDSITTYGTRFFWTDELVKKIARNMNPESLPHTLPDYAGLLNQKHGSAWVALVQDTLMVMNEMVQHPMNEHDLKNIKTRVQLLVGDKDLLAYPEETMKVAKLIDQSSFKIIQNGVHDLAKLDESQLQFIYQSIFFS